MSTLLLLSMTFVITVIIPLFLLLLRPSKPTPHPRTLHLEHLLSHFYLKNQKHLHFLFRITIYMIFILYWSQFIYTQFDFIIYILVVTIFAFIIVLLPIGKLLK